MDDRSDPETAAIEALVEAYFLGMYGGDVERLRRIFHPQYDFHRFLPQRRY